MFAQESVMDIKKEREAFLNVYVNYKGDSRKIQFNEETEQFMWRKNNVSDTEVEYVHLMNQRWYAWLACAKSKAQAVPEGFVVLKISDVREILSNASDAMDAESPSSVFTQTGIPSTWYDHHLVAEKNILDAIKAQEPTND